MPSLISINYHALSCGIFRIILLSYAVGTVSGCHEERKFTVCGDTHGQFYDLVNIFELNGVPSAGNPYLFNGLDSTRISLPSITPERNACCLAVAVGGCGRRRRFRG